MYDYDENDALDYACSEQEEYYMDEWYADDEPDLDFTFECDSALSSAGWGTDEDYGYYGNEDAGMEYGLWGSEA